VATSRAFTDLLAQMGAHRMSPRTTHDAEPARIERFIIARRE
jgi:hypothetical protein